MMMFKHTTDRWSRRRNACAGIAALGGALLFSGTVPTLAHEAHGHPARIHEGACDALGPVAYRLNGIGGSVDLDNAPVATPTAVNPDSSYQVLVSETPIDAPLDELLAAEHAVMVYESDEAMEAIACGNIGGAMVADDALITGLAEMGVPGHLGFAFFSSQGEQTLVSLIIGHAMAPVSAAGESADHTHAAGEEPNHEPDDEEANHESIATPAA